ncbi:WD40 repeat domain-containing protein [Phanerochaete sordida]|uniref:WD40 repeat domain-containing protein n=1 Tax=Phanerochaete sordida TaxID=48140 RepID=A0A9P3LGW9_9APHY|nr:WD40 repeat domain-containing protein [Phanerochaete sordida]
MFTIYRASNSEAAHKIYPSCLSRLGLGYPLWHPEPHDTGSPQIGDVGYARDGAFVRLFNINTSFEHYRVTTWSPQFDVREELPSKLFYSDKRHSPIGPGRFPSRGVEEIEVRGDLAGGAAGSSVALSASYGCREVHGALLVLKSHASAESLYDNRDLEAYMIREHENWHAYAQGDVGHRVEPGEIVLVCGWVKAPADWATAAFSNSSSTRGMSIGGQIAQFFGLSLSGLRRRSYSGPPMERCGTKYPDTADTNDPKNQCIFVKRYKIKKRAGLVRVILAGAGYDDPRIGGDDDKKGPDLRALAPATSERANELLFESQQRPFDPLDVLLEYILEVSKAQVALARDEDLEEMFGGEVCPIDLPTYLRKRQPPVVVEGVVGRVSINELLARERNKLHRRRITAPDLVRWPNITARGAANISSGSVDLLRGHKRDEPTLSSTPFLQVGSGAGKLRAPNSFALSPDGSLLAVSWESPRITLWRTSDGLRLNVLADLEHRHEVNVIAFSSDGKCLASGTFGRTVVLWDAVHAASLACLRGHNTMIVRLAFSPRGRHLASGSMDGMVFVWDLSTGRPSYRYVASDGSGVRQLVFNYSGSLLAAVFRSKVILFNIDTHISERAEIPFDATREDATVAFSPDGSHIAVASRVSAGVYATDNAQRKIEIGGKNDGAAFATYSADGKTIASISSGCAMMQDAVTGGIILKLPISGAASTLALSSDGKFLVTPFAQRDVMVWDARTGDRMALLQNVSELPITDLRFLPDSRRILFAGDTGPIGTVNIADISRVR